MTHEVEVGVFAKQLLEEVGHGGGDWSGRRHHGHTVPVETSAHVDEEVAWQEVT